MKAYLLKESLERLWTYTYEGAMLRYLKSWTLQLRWQRLPAFEKLAPMLIDHLDARRIGRRQAAALLWMIS